MPLNEASARPSNLTKRQKHEALAALYGIPAAVDDLEAEELRQKLSEYSPPNE